MGYKKPNRYSYRLGVSDPKDTILQINPPMFGYLCSFIYYDSEYIDMIYLLPLYESEINLNSGRFRFRSDCPQNHLVQVVSMFSLIEVSDKMNRTISFIDENVKHSWNLVAWPVSDTGYGKVILDFTFDDRDEAILLKMFM